MQRIYISGRRPLSGRVAIGGAKNSAVALIPAALMGRSPTTLENLPMIRDVDLYLHLLKELGVKAELRGSRLWIDPSSIEPKPLPNGEVKKLRASYYLMGALLGRFKEAVVGLPGGCDLGPRPIDQHVKGFEALGAEVVHEGGALHLKARELIGNRIFLDMVSVGATINIMLAAVYAKGTTVIENAAKEPEIIDVATLLTSMGANIKGAGTNVIRITGVDELGGTTHSMIPDRIEAGTYMIAAAATEGEVALENVIPLHLESLIAKLREMGVGIEEREDEIRVYGPRILQPADIKTLVYPGFPTDLQQPIAPLLTKAKGTSIITDTIYAHRFKHVDELRRMGARIKVEGRSAIIEGGSPLEGTRVQATDLRAGASLVIAGLMAEGTTRLTGVEHIERGYENMVEKLRDLGAQIEVSQEEA
ncbi:UDP-N-acetylglucosamine 1-carboxyvinyltransferase [Thermicanus aegyptius]|uniref:UDP-N-acetylglucosamine 1-carboxyvinyltransferase n=1 Tax=Thermicanus aegyptius TaxID=94009 RepID=UPI0004289F1F|nr:UDP-N-acetylglucosamine 1-carboxyvinyltransferase [Thermicanus aegyptius]